MYPVFVSIPIPGFLQGLLGPVFSIHTYGVMVALGFFFAISAVTSEARRKNLDADAIVNLLFGLILWGIVGSRLLFVALEWKSYVDRPLAILNIREGGLVFQGGLVCAGLYGVVSILRQKLPFWKTVDAVIVGVPLGHAFGRLGCTAAGCCFGKPTDLPWAITFTDPGVAGAPLNLPLHPVQLYESLGNLIIFVVLLLLARRGKFRSDGQVLASYLLAYPILRYVTELFRGDEVRGFFMQESLGQALSTSQAISVVELILGIGLYAYLRHKPQGTSDASPSQAEA